MDSLRRKEGGKRESLERGLYSKELLSLATKLLDKKEQNNSLFLSTKLVKSTEVSPRASPTALSTTNKKSRKSLRDEADEEKESTNLPKTPRHHSIKERISKILKAARAWESISD